MTRDIQTLLIANRGEISVRIIRTARQMGIRTVAVFSEADRYALHTSLADTSVFIGEGPVNQTYLDKEKILNAMVRSGADAVHPGYGFLSEDADFASQVLEAGFIWVGPPVDAMNAMASKASAKQTLEPKGVPMIPGYHGDEQSDERLIAESEHIGYPLLVKASAGGGGKGMKVVTEPEDLPDAIASARREAKSSFGDDRLLLEKYLIKPRHVEVQILADQHGEVLSLFERDCSLQRRHQKVLEEAPAHNLDLNTKKQMWIAAEKAAKEIGYVGAGTVEFILSATGEFFFLEMNTRLQVEHPVTEYITGLDLVEWQLKIAAGAVLDVELPAEPIGHSIEARLYAEDPSQNFQPMVGRIEHLTYPAGDGVRFDTGVEAGADVSPFYDPMLAKVIVHAEDREAALNKLKRVLGETRCIGLTTNLEFLRQLVHQPEVKDMTIHTRWLDDSNNMLHAKQLESIPVWAALSQAVLCQSHNQQSPQSWERHSGWRMDGYSQWQYALNENSTVFVSEKQGQWTITLEDQQLLVQSARWSSVSDHSGRLHAEVDGLSIEWDVYFKDNQVWLDNGDRIETVSWWLAAKAHDHDVEKVGKATAVLPGVVTAVYKKVGDKVTAGEKILSFEAMKMETTQVAEVDGVLKVIPWQVGDQISEGDVLFEIDDEGSEL